MAKCGIKKYDDLEARVGFVDVDSLRFALVENTKERDWIIKMLEIAYEESKKRM